MPFEQEECKELLVKTRGFAAKTAKHDVSNDYIIAESPLMQKILKDVSTIAKSTSSVFVSGESGTGKEVIAQAIHRLSLRSGQAFIKVNCAAIPAPLLESEFFGHEKGAFTGAIQRRIGRFELADKGTLLLDEISEIPLELQPKLLRAVQEMEFERVGGTQHITVDVRLISTSNRLMKEAVEQKLFREDLYYRLNVVPIYLPPLRDRQEDIVPLAEYFLQRVCRENNKPVKTFTAEAKRMLLAYQWPGNIRELANVIERIVIMHAADIIDSEGLPLDVFKLESSFLKPACVGTLKEMERQWILETLKRQQNNRTRTAQALGISVRTLRNKLKEYHSNSV